MFLSFSSYGELIPTKNAKLQGVEWNTTSEIKSRFKSYFEEFNDKQWDVLKFKIKVDQISKELFSNGYFSSSVKFELTGSESSIIVKLTIIAPEKINFHFLGNQIFSHQELRKKIVDKIRNDFGKSERSVLEAFINDEYENAGFYNSVIKSYQNNGRDLDGVAVKTYFFDIDEGEKIKVSSVIYRGNVFWSPEELENIFTKNATSLALADYYDKTFFENLQVSSR